MSATNASRIFLPSSLRIGMFCKLGSVEASRPVLVPAIEYEVCTRPVSGWICSCNASVYVDFNLLSCRQSRTRPGRTCSIASSSRTSTPVAYAPVLPFFPPGMLISSNNISPSCLGDPKLKLRPANS